MLYIKIKSRIKNPWLEESNHVLSMDEVSLRAQGHGAVELGRPYLDCQRMKFDRQPSVRKMDALPVGFQFCIVFGRFDLKCPYQLVNIISSTTLPQNAST